MRPAAALRGPQAENAAGLEGARPAWDSLATALRGAATGSGAGPVLGAAGLRDRVLRRGIRVRDQRPTGFGAGARRLVGAPGCMVAPAPRTTGDDMMTPEERYRTDPRFHTLVCRIKDVLDGAQFTPDEVRE